MPTARCVQQNMQQHSSNRNKVIPHKINTHLTAEKFKTMLILNILPH